MNWIDPSGMSWESIQNALTSVGNKVKEAAQKAVAPIVNAVKTTVNTVANVAKQAVNTVKTAVQSTVSTVKTVAQSALTQAKQAVDTVKTVPKSAVQSAAKAATTVKSTVATWAETAAQKVANSINSKTLKVIETAQQKVKQTSAKTPTVQNNTFLNTANNMACGSAGASVNAIDPVTLLLLLLGILGIGAATTGCTTTISTQDDMPTPTVTPSATPVPVIPIELDYPNPTPGATSVPLPPGFVTPTPKPSIALNENEKDAVIRIAQESGASELALNWIRAASDFVGKDYPPVINKKIVETPGSYHCAQVIEEVLKRDMGISVGGSCYKQRKYFLEHNDTWIYETDEFSIEDLCPGDFIYWKEESDRYPTHAGIYCGNGYMIDSTRSGGGVAYRRVEAFQETPENTHYIFYAYARYKEN